MVHAPFAIVDSQTRNPTRSAAKACGRSRSRWSSATSVGL